MPTGSPQASISFLAGKYKVLFCRNNSCSAPAEKCCQVLPAKLGSCELGSLQKVDSFKNDFEFFKLQLAILCMKKN
jgi:hypothetical protein